MTRRNDPCPCGSGRRYKQCCGRVGAATATPTASPHSEFQRLGAASARGAGEPEARRVEGTPGDVLVVEHFLTAAECRRLIEVGEAQPSEDARIVVKDGGTGESGTRVRSSDRRITTTIKTVEVGNVFVPIVGLACQQWLEPVYGREIEWFEWPDVLKYGPGGRYDLHADAELRDPETGEWARVQERDYSLLIYLNEEFTGGAIEFPRYDYRVQPRRGMLVAFPSDHRYEHAALPVESGIRYVIVSWAAAVGSERLHEGVRGGVIYTDPKYQPAALRGR